MLRDGIMFLKSLTELWLSCAKARLAGEVEERRCALPPPPRPLPSPLRNTPPRPLANQLVPLPAGLGEASAQEECIPPDDLGARVPDVPFATRVAPPHACACSGPEAGLVDLHRLEGCVWACGLCHHEEPVREQACHALAALRTLHATLLLSPPYSPAAPPALLATHLSCLPAPSLKGALDLPMPSLPSPGPGDASAHLGGTFFGSAINLHGAGFGEGFGGGAGGGYLARSKSGSNASAPYVLPSHVRQQAAESGARCAQP